MRRLCVFVCFFFFEAIFITINFTFHSFINRGRGGGGNCGIMWTIEWRASERERQEHRSRKRLINDYQNSLPSLHTHTHKHINTQKLMKNSLFINFIFVHLLCWINQAIVCCVTRESSVIVWNTPMTVAKQWAPHNLWCVSCEDAAGVKNLQTFASFEQSHRIRLFFLIV